MTLCVEEKFICADCEHKCLALNDTHTKKHTLVRVTQKVEESKVSTEERLMALKVATEERLKALEVSTEERLKCLEGQLESVQEELSKMRQLFEKLFERGVEGSPSDPLTKGDILDAVMAEPSLGGPLLAKGEGDGGGENREGSGVKVSGGE